MLLIVSCVLAFVCIAALVIAFVHPPARSRLRDRLAALSVVRDEDLPLDQSLDRGFFTRVVAPTLLRLGNLIERLTPAGAVGGARAKLERAGNPLRITATQFLGLRGLSIVAGVSLAIAVHGMGYFDGLLNTATALCITIAAVLLPDYLLQDRVNRREQLMRKTLPDSLDLLVASTEAGLGLDQAINEVATRKPGPLSEEFARVVKEINLGKTRSEAWRSLSERVGLDDLRSFAAAIYQAESLGASIANVLRAQSEALRSRRTMKLREVAGKLPTKMLFPLIFCIFPSLFVVFLGPAMISIYKALRVM
ncbi:MAG: type II secretion system F family protein [Armatimonadota bacterium]